MTYLIIFFLGLHDGSEKQADIFLFDTWNQCKEEEKKYKPTTPGAIADTVGYCIRKYDRKGQ